jgi:hypothetical protein
MACEDYPCCGHGPTSTGGDGGGCPEIDDEGRQRWRCLECGEIMPPRAPSSICYGCRNRRANMDPEEREYQDELRENYERDSGGW